MHKQAAQMLNSSFQHHKHAISDEDHIRDNVGFALSPYADHLSESMEHGSAKARALQGLGAASAEISAALQAGLASYVNSQGHTSMKQLLTDVSNGVVKLEKGRYDNAKNHLMNIASYLN